MGITTEWGRVTLKDESNPNGQLLSYFIFTYSVVPPLLYLCVAYNTHTLLPADGTFFNSREDLFHCRRPKMALSTLSAMIMMMMMMQYLLFQVVYTLFDKLYMGYVYIFIRDIYPSPV